MNPEHRGQEFSDFLDELGIRGEVEAQAIKEILADEIRSAMEKEGLTKTAMAARMRTSRRARPSQHQRHAAHHAEGRRGSGSQP